MDNSDPLLSELCSICHINPPKYRCPRCSTRTCSLPCTRRHKLWSQCTGVRDPAAYLKRSEINESSFDRDFNFITGIERSLERADRDVENRGIDLARGQIEQDDTDDTQESGAGQKRKRPQQSFVKGEAGFLRGAEAGAVNVIRAPRGMTRNKQNNSKWHPKHKCLSWSVEWISAGGEKVLRACLENCSIGDGYDRGFPLPKKEKTQAEVPEESKSDLQQGGAATEDSTDAAATTSTAQDTTQSTTESADAKTEQPPSTSEVEKPTETTEEEKPQGEEETQDLPIVPHRDLYFYLHRPRTTVKKPVLVPLAPQKTLAASLRNRTVLEFPSIYALPDSPEKLLEEKETSPFMLEEEYLRTVGPEDAAKPEPEQEDTENDSSGLQSGPDLQNLDEQHVLEVLKQDLFEAE